MPFTPYRPDPGVHDDLLAPDRSLRSVWGDVGVVVAAAAQEGRLARWQQDAERALLSAGAGHLVAEPAGVEDGAAAFRYDPVPVIIGAQEWVGLRAGLVQRVRLLDAVLADLYGPRRLLADGTLPSAAVVGARSYLRTAIGLSPARWVVRSATDVVRDATGRFVALLDHTDVPVGVGYALAYRAVSARLLTDGLRSLGVDSPAAWLSELRSAAAAVAPATRENPRTVVLATAASPRFVDHSILATQLGYHLAEDADLAVSGRRLVLRSLGGLEEIDGVLRCTDELATDPLEVAGSVGGVPGLQALSRRHMIGMANPLGSGLAGHIGLQPFLGRLCERVLGEPLMLANVESLWCGDPDHQAAVLADLGSWVLHDTTPVRGSAEGGAVFGDRLSDADAELWRRRITDEPHRVVAQRKLELGTSPIESRGGLVPGVVSMRFFASNGPRGVRVMQGGIGRVLQQSVPVVSQSSAVGKDLWIVGTAAGHERMLGAVGRPELLPQIDLGASIPTRAAEAMYWMGRNAERVDMIARLAGVVLQRLEQDPWAAGLGDGAFAAAVSRALEAVSGGAGHRTSLTGEARIHDALGRALGDRPGGLGDAAARLVAGARSVRQYLSTSTWRVLAPIPGDAAAAVEEFAKTAEGDGFPPLTLEALERVSLSLAGFSGLVNDSIVRGPGWRFLEIGRRVERSLMVLGLVEALLVSLPDDAEQPAYEVLLAGCESLVAYRRRHRSHLVPDTIAANLLADPDNPRSVAFQLDALHALLGRLPERGAIAVQRKVVTEARRSSAVPIATATDVVERVLSVRSALLAMAEAIPQAWFRVGDVRARRVRAGGGR